MTSPSHASVRRIVGHLGSPRRREPRSRLVMLGPGPNTCLWPSTVLSGPWLDPRVPFESELIRYPVSTLPVVDPPVCNHGKISLLLPAPSPLLRTPGGCSVLGAPVIQEPSEPLRLRSWYWRFAAEEFSIIRVPEFPLASPQPHPE